MEQYILKTTLGDDTVLVSSRFSNKAFKALGAEMKKQGIGFSDLENIEDMVGMLDCLDAAILIMFERPYMEYCKEKKLPIEYHDINTLIDDMFPKELMAMRGKVISWYIEAFSEMTITEKNIQASKPTKKTKQNPALTPAN